SGQVAPAAFLVGDLGQFLLGRIHAFGPALVDNAHAVTEDDVPDADAQQDLGDGHPRSTGAIDDHQQVLELLAHQPGPVDKGSQGDNGGAVLVIVEDGN